MSTWTYNGVVPGPRIEATAGRSSECTQHDRGLYGPLIVADPHEPLGYDEGFTVLLDDWLDGIGGTPDDALRRLNSTTQHDDTLRSDALGGVAAELRHPLYLVNGRTPDTPATFAGTPGRRVRFRVINAAADTALRYDVLVRGRARVRSAASWRHPRPLGIRARRAHLRTACATR